MRRVLSEQDRPQTQFDPVGAVEAAPKISRSARTDLLRTPMSRSASRFYKATSSAIFLAMSSHESSSVLRPVAGTEERADRPNFIGGVRDGNQLVASLWGAKTRLSGHDLRIKLLQVRT